MRAALCLLLAAVLTAPAVAAEDPVAAWVRKLGNPATAETIAVALADAKQTQDGPLLLAQALGTARGPAAAEALGTLLKRSEAGVRREALASLVRVGLRSEALAEAVYGSLRGTAREPAERHEAALALGTVGDGADMDTLLALASPEQEDTRLREQAFRAMVGITGKKLPYVHSRWTFWWGKQKASGLEQLSAALDGAEKASGTPALAAHAAVISSLGWVDAGTTRRRLETWLRGSREDLQSVACAAAAHLRLGDLARSIEALADGRGKPALRRAAQAALERLGVTAGGPGR